MISKAAANAAPKASAKVKNIGSAGIPGSLNPPVTATRERLPIPKPRIVSGDGIRD